MPKRKGGAPKGNKNAAGKRRSATIPAFITGMFHKKEHEANALKVYERYNATKAYKAGRITRRVGSLGILK